LAIQKISCFYETQRFVRAAINHEVTAPLTCSSLTKKVSKTVEVCTAQKVVTLQELGKASFFNTVFLQISYIKKKKNNNNNNNNNISEQKFWEFKAQVCSNEVTVS